MRELSPDLLSRLRMTLLRSAAFDRDEYATALFVDARLSLWRDDVPSADTRNHRVDALLDALRNRTNNHGESALALLLRVLAERCDPADARQGELAALADEVERIFKGAVFISYKRHTEPDEGLALALYEALLEQGYKVFIDQTMRTGSAWLDEIDQQLCASDALVVLLSPASADSAMIKAEVSRAYDYRKCQGKPLTLPVRVRYAGLLPYAIAAFLDPLQYALWETEADTARVLQDIVDVLAGQIPQRVPVLERTSVSYLSSPTLLLEDGRYVSDSTVLHPPLPEFDPRFLEDLEAPGGAVKLSDAFYIERDADTRLRRELARTGTTTTIRAPRQTGKSSLLARGREAARGRGAKVISLDLQSLDRDYLETADTFLRYLAETITHRLRLDIATLEKQWRGRFGPQDKLTYFLEDYVLTTTGDVPLVLALDEADRLLKTDFYKDFFALLRAWHNRRADDPLWQRLNLALIISTEPYLLIPDGNQSPFNVGLNLYLEDFTTTQVAELNRRYHSPVSERDFPGLLSLLGGHPYLTRKALYTLVTEQLTWDELMQIAVDDRGPFSDHLRHNLWLLRDAPDLRAAFKQVIDHAHCTDELLFFCLLRAGLVKGRGAVCACRCDLYQMYFKERL